MLLRLILVLIFALGGVVPVGQPQVYDSIVSCFDSAISITVITNGNGQTFKNGSEEYIDIMNALNSIAEGRRDMPAFGVSLDNETKEAKKSGMWIELNYDTTIMYNEMPFDALLIEVVEEHSGFNLIRKNNGKYDGRCFYLNLEGNMQKLYNIISEIV